MHRVHRDWMIVLAAVVCTTGCMGTGRTGGMESTVSGLATHGSPQGLTTPESTQPNGWASAWKNNPVAKWFSQKPSSSGAIQSESQQQVPSNLDPVSLGFASGPPNAQLYVSMAEISDKGGNPQQARLLYQKARSLEPDNLPSLLGLARLEDRQGQLDKAIEIYQQAITAHPQSTAPLNDLAICYARKNQLEASLGLLEQAVRLQPDKPLYRNNIAKVLTELKRSDEALVHLAVVHSPAVAHYNLGVLLAQRGRTEEATRYLALAEEIDPAMQEARSLLDQLNKDSLSSPNNQVQLATRPNASHQRMETDSVRKAVEEDGDGILPTRYPTGQTNMPGTPAPGIPVDYPATGIPPTVSIPQPTPKTLTATISELPIGDAPLLLPPVN